jgi:hypothetical protein
VFALLLLGSTFAFEINEALFRPFRLNYLHPPLSCSLHSGFEEMILILMGLPSSPVNLSTVTTISLL